MPGTDALAEGLSAFNAGRFAEAAALFAPAAAWRSALAASPQDESARCGLAEEDFRAALSAAPGMWKAEAYVAEMALCRGRAREAWRRMERLTARLTGPLGPAWPI